VTLTVDAPDVDACKARVRKALDTVGTRGDLKGVCDRLESLLRCAWHHVPDTLTGNTSERSAQIVVLNSLRRDLLLFFVWY